MKISSIVIVSVHTGPVPIGYNHIADITTRQIYIECTNWLKRVGWLNARATEQNCPGKFIEYWIAVQARIDIDRVVKAKTPP